jgi:hypothetical protein
VGRDFHAQLVFEVLVKGLHVDLMGSVLPAAELGGVDQVDQILPEVLPVCPLFLVPVFKIDDGPRSHFALQKLAVLGRDLLARPCIGEPGNRLRRLPVFHLGRVDEDLVREIQLTVGSQARTSEVG